MLEQLSYLIEEMEALREVIDRVPEPILAGRPTGNELSIKELYGVIALADEEVFSTYIEAMAEGEEPKLAVPNDEALARQEPWQERDIHDILERVREARKRLVDIFGGLPAQAWQQTATAEDAQIDLYGLARYVVQRDTAILRIVGMRLHESNLTQREQDLPK